MQLFYLAIVYTNIIPIFVLIITKNDMKAKQYVALVVVNGEMVTKNLEACNLGEARTAAETYGAVICVAVNKPGSKINF